MIGFIHQLWHIPNQLRKAILNPANDPRAVYGPAHQPREAYSEKEEPDLDKVRTNLEKGFASLTSETGLTVLQDLVEEFEQLQPLLSRRKNSDPLAIAQVPALAQETYRQGMSILVDALDLAKTMDSSGVGKLQSEATKLESEMESMGGDENQVVRLRMKEELLASNKELLEMIAQQQVRVDELFHQSHLCQVSLHRTRIELAAIRADTSETKVSTYTDTLRRTIAQAKEVQEEMKRLGF